MSISPRFLFHTWKALSTVAITHSQEAHLQGGLGDVGKYVISHALKTEGLTVKPIAMTSESTAEPKFDFEVDVHPQSLQDELKSVFDEVSPAQV